MNAIGVKSGDTLHEDKSSRQKLLGAISCTVQKPTSRHELTAHRSKLGKQNEPGFPGERWKKESYTAFI